MIRRMSLVALALVALPLAAQQPANAPVRAARDTGITPTIDAGRALEAEVRIALNDLLANRTIPALQRLQWLASTSSSSPATPSSSSMLRDRGDVLFLLAESQYRLGMDSSFRTNAQSVLSGGPARYAPLLRAQLLLSAYRTGDYARVSSLLAQTPAEGQTRGLADLVAGLAAYQLRNYPEAAAKFTAAKAGGGPYGQYAEYMDILTSLRKDTTQTAAALPRLDALAQGATGVFADQVRLTAAQLAYQSGAFDRAIAFASAVSPNSGLSALSQLTKAWAQYKSKDVAGAGQSFAAFADQYPQLPQRDEARLMAAQSLLQLGKTDEAARLFRLVSDSGRAEAQRLDSKSSSAVSTLAQALVRARAAGLLFVNDPAMGKTLALEESAGADPLVLASVMSGSSPALPQVEVAHIVTLSDLSQRFTEVQRTAAGDLPGRVLFASPSSNAAPSQFAQRAEAVLAADIDDAIASQRLRLATRNVGLRLMQIRGLQGAMQGRGDTLAKLIARVDTTDARLARLLRAVDSTETNLKASLITQVRNVVGGPAYVLAVRADSLRRRGLIPPGLDVEALVAARADSQMDALPLFLLRDSVRTRLGRVRDDLAKSKAAIDDADRLFAAARTGQLTDTSAMLAQLRSTRSAAESRRTQAEAALVATVISELSARASEMLALLQHDMQAAEFGTATASFFNAIDQGRPPGSPGSSDRQDLQNDANGAASASARVREGTTGVITVGASKPTPTRNAGTPPNQKK